MDHAETVRTAVKNTTKVEEIAIRLSSPKRRDRDETSLHLNWAENPFLIVIALLLLCRPVCWHATSLGRATKIDPMIALESIHTQPGFEQSYAVPQPNLGVSFAASRSRVFCLARRCHPTACWIQ